MFVASLISGTAPLAPLWVENLRSAWGGGDAKWLGEGAAEFALPSPPDTYADVWQELQTQAIDLNILPAEGRRKRLLLADMDSTMIDQECIDELADFAGVGDRVKAITARAMNGEIDFDSALRERVGLLKGLPTGIVQEVIETRITYAAGGDVLLATMKAAGATTALVSGGFTHFTNVVAQHLGFDSHRANSLLDHDGKFTGAVQDPILGSDAKVARLEALTAELSLSDRDVLAVGDGANDLGMLTRAGMGVALHAKPSVAAQSSVKIMHGDLTALLHLQGYHKDAFVYP